MGNSSSNGIVCCVGPTYTVFKDENLGKKPGSAGATEKTSISSSMKEPVQEGFSFSSISSKSSNDSNSKGKENRPFTPDEMRNDDTEWCHSISDEIRVAESSYDEATTEAVNYYYGDSRYPMSYIRGNRADATERRDQ